MKFSCVSLWIFDTKTLLRCHYGFCNKYFPHVILVADQTFLCSPFDSQSATYLTFEKITNLHRIRPRFYIHKSLEEKLSPLKLRRTYKLAKLISVLPRRWQKTQRYFVSMQRFNKFLFRLRRLKGRELHRNLRYAMHQETCISQAKFLFSCENL